MQLAFSSNAYLHFSIEETIRRIAGIGYKGIELLADVPHAWPAGLLPERVEAIRRALDDPEGSARIGAAGRDRVITRWSWRNTAERTVEHYRALLAES